MRYLYILFIFSLGLLSCTDFQQTDYSYIDSLNDRAYSLRYSQIDSSLRYAKKAYSLSKYYPDGKAESLHNLAYIAYQQMCYDKALHLIKHLYQESSNQIELLCADVLKMKISQRTGQGYDFFDSRNHALKRISRVHEAREILTERQRKRLYYATTEFHIVSSTYYYYLGQDSLATSEINSIEKIINLDQDTTQYLYYHYMLGSGGLIYGDELDVKLAEFDHLFLTYTLAKAYDFYYFEANALQSFSALFLDSINSYFIQSKRHDAFEYLVSQHLSWMSSDAPDSISQLSFSLSQHSLKLFLDYKDLYQSACVYRTIGDIYFASKHYQQSLDYYLKSLSLIDSQKKRSSYSIVAWMASIYERLSLAYSAINDKDRSCFYRNNYLDLLDYSRQDKELNARLDILSKELLDVRIKLMFMFFLIILVAILLFIYLRRIGHYTSIYYNDFINIRQTDLFSSLRTSLSTLRDKQFDDLEWLDDEIRICESHIQNYRHDNVESRAKVSLVYSIIPYLNRIIAEVERIKVKNTNSTDSLLYIHELTDEVIRINDVLTEWIKIKHGNLKLHVTTFPLQKILNVISFSKTVFSKQGLILKVPQTDFKVKADEALTLFMVNTLADNARKFTAEGGVVEIQLNATQEYVEISILDSGMGLSEDDVNTLNNSKIYDSSRLGISKDNKGFGFGIMNCKGVINNYKKLSNIFHVCDFGVESKLGEGSRFWFRLPRILSLVFMLIYFTPFYSSDVTKDSYSFYDSTYEANVLGRYEEALLYADSALLYLNNPMDTALVVRLRNEMAIASLALHLWDDYRYNNDECVRLHWLYSRDNSISTYCQQIEKARADSSILLVILLFLSIIALFFIYVIFIRERINNRLTITSLYQQLTDVIKKMTFHFDNLLSVGSNSYSEVKVKHANFQKELDICYINAKNVTHKYNNLSLYIDKLYEEASSVLQELIEFEDSFEHRNEYFNKIHFEEERLYVMNQILDNSLSTIKHETMYYPSRIQQIVDLMRNHNVDQETLFQLSELLSYYKYIYLLLYEQAERQIEQYYFHRDSISTLDIILDVGQTVERYNSRNHYDIEFVCDVSDSIIQCDIMLLHSIFDYLLLSNAHSVTLFRVFTTEVSDSVISFNCELYGPDISKEKIDSLFTPSRDSIPYMIIRQIIREHDMQYSYPGLRLLANKIDGGFSLMFTLVKK